MSDDADELERGIEAQRLAALERLQKSAASPPPPPDGDVARMLADVGALVAAERELTAKLGRRPTIEELAAQTALPPQRVAQVTMVAPPPRVLEDEGE